MNGNSRTRKNLFRLSFNIIVILFALVALLPTKKLVAVETIRPGSQIQVAQDEADPVALTCTVAGPQTVKDFVYLTPAGTTRFLESSFVSSPCYRGPPSLF